MKNPQHQDLAFHALFVKGYRGLSLGASPGSEMLAMQGLSCSDLKPDVVASESTLADLSGNSFSAPVIMACLLTMLTVLPLDTESESEELMGIRNMFQMSRFSQT